MSTRREFITLLGGAAAAWSMAVSAQQRPLSLIGYLDPRSIEWICRGRQNFLIEYRWAEHQPNPLRCMRAAFNLAPVGRTALRPD
jgi:hypothetical protein